MSKKLISIIHGHAAEVYCMLSPGHSLGGALASMCAFDIAWSKINRVGDKPDGDYIPVTAFTFEAPRVGQCSSLPILVQHPTSGEDICIHHRVNIICCPREALNNGPMPMHLLRRAKFYRQQGVRRCV